MSSAMVTSSEERNTLSGTLNKIQTNGAVVTSYVEIGKLTLEKKVEMSKVYR